MRDRLGEFALSLHPAKTRLIEFGRFATTDRKRHGLGKPETFTFLGFTFIWGRSRRGTFVLQRKTRRDRMRRRLKDIKVELQRRMHQPIPEQGKWLSQVVTGHFAYYAVPTNSRALSAFRRCVTERMVKLVNDWLPPPRILHPWLEGACHSRICRRRSALLTTVSELKLIAAAAMIGLSSKPHRG
jgi:RNA-directed DNA polymerase